jgi:hypothetical protein
MNIPANMSPLEAIHPRNNSCDGAAEKHIETAKAAQRPIPMRSASSENKMQSSKYRAKFIEWNAKGLNPNMYILRLWTTFGIGLQKWTDTSFCQKGAKQSKKDCGSWKPII